MVVVASLVGYAQAYDYYCYSNLNVKVGYAGDYWYLIYARAYGCFFVPSDGNLYFTIHYGNGYTNAPFALVFNFGLYEENGCAGDAFHSVTIMGIDTDGDGWLDHFDIVGAAVKAPPCGAT
jgi:hypothetical protein